MSNFFFRIGGTLGLIVLSLGLTTSSRAADTKTYPILGACEASTDVFPGTRYLFVQDPIARLSTDYHATVNRIVNAHLKKRKIECSDEVKEVPSTGLSNLARVLPPWKDPEDLQELAETDIGPVLLEYLRIYECTLKEERFFLPSRVAKDAASRNLVNIPAWFGIFADRWGRISEELFYARKSLERTLAYLGGMDRLRPVDASLECLQRASLDIRNILGLTADTSACLPRAWDVRTSLRDASESSSSQPSES